MSRLQGGLFGLRKPSDLFCKAQKDVKDFFEAPTDYALFNLVLHLKSSARLDRKKWVHI